MDIREYFQKEQKGFYKIIAKTLTAERRKQLYDAINDWHESELKLLGIDDPPTDVDIETWATHICGGCSQESLYERTGLISGAKWMRGILTQKQNQR